MAQSLATRTRARWSDDPDVSDPLWQTFSSTRSLRARNALVEHYLPLVRIEAIKTARLSPLEIDELASYGAFGLIDAIERFDLDKGVRFATYAAHRVRGAILDEVRKDDWVPRSVRSMERATQHAEERLSSDLGREPTESELAQRLEVSVAELRRRRVESATRRVFLDELGPSRDDGDSRAIQIHDLTQQPEQSASIGELTRHLAEAVARLSTQDRVVITLRYSEELTLEELGAVFGVTTGRCQHMINAALEHLEASIQGESPRGWR